MTNSNLYISTDGVLVHNKKKKEITGSIATDLFNIIIDNIVLHNRIENDNNDIIKFDNMMYNNEIKFTFY